MLDRLSRPTPAERRLSARTARALAPRPAGVLAGADPAPQPEGRRWHPRHPTPPCRTRSGRDTPALLEQTIGDNLDATVARVPDRDALVDRATGMRMTYAELGAEVDRLARGLVGAGIGKGDRVGIWAPNCAEWVLTQYATAKVGAILVNINPAYRSHELTYVLNQAGIRMVVIAPSFKSSDYVAMVDAARDECPALEQVVVIGEDSWDDLLAPRRRGEPRAADHGAGRARARRPDQHPVHLGHHRVSPRARRSRTTTSSTTATSSGRAAATPRRTGSASRCPSTTASAW